MQFTLVVLVTCFVLAVCQATGNPRLHGPCARVRKERGGHPCSLFRNVSPMASNTKSKLKPLSMSQKDEQHQKEQIKRPRTFKKVLHTQWSKVSKETSEPDAKWTSKIKHDRSLMSATDHGVTLRTNLKKFTGKHHDGIQTELALKKDLVVGNLQKLEVLPKIEDIKDKTVQAILDTFRGGNLVVDSRKLEVLPKVKDIKGKTVQAILGAFRGGNLDVDNSRNLEVLPKVKDTKVEGGQAIHQDSLQGGNLVVDKSRKLEVLPKEKYIKDKTVEAILDAFRGGNQLDVENSRNIEMLPKVEDIEVKESQAIQDPLRGGNLVVDNSRKLEVLPKVKDIKVKGGQAIHQDLLRGGGIVVGKPRKVEVPPTVKDIKDKGSQAILDAFRGGNIVVGKPRKPEVLRKVKDKKDPNAKKIIESLRGEVLQSLNTLKGKIYGGQLSDVLLSNSTSDKIKNHTFINNKNVEFGHKILSRTKVNRNKDHEVRYETAARVHSKEGKRSRSHHKSTLKERKNIHWTRTKVNRNKDHEVKYETAARVHGKEGKRSRSHNKSTLTERKNIRHWTRKKVNRKDHEVKYETAARVHGKEGGKRPRSHHKSTLKERKKNHWTKRIPASWYHDDGQETTGARSMANQALFANSMDNARKWANSLDLYQFFGKMNGLPMRDIKKFNANSMHGADGRLNGLNGFGGFGVMSRPQAAAGLTPPYVRAEGYHGNNAQLSQLIQSERNLQSMADNSFNRQAQLQGGVNPGMDSAGLGIGNVAPPHPSDSSLQSILDKDNPITQFQPFLSRFYTPLMSFHPRHHSWLNPGHLGPYLGQERDQDREQDQGQAQGQEEEEPKPSFPDDKDHESYDDGDGDDDDDNEGDEDDDDDYPDERKSRLLNSH